MAVLDNKCFFVLQITDQRTNLAHIENNLIVIEELLKELSRFPDLAKDEFVSIFSNNSIQMKTKAKNGTAVPSGE